MYWLCWINFFSTVLVFVCIKNFDFALEQKFLEINNAEWPDVVVVMSSDDQLYYWYVHKYQYIVLSN